MQAMGIDLLALATWWDVLKVAKDSQTFDARTLSEVEAFLHDPVGWSVKHGGKGDDVSEAA
jgi:orotate phosphoribosyltransferase